MSIEYAEIRDSVFSFDDVHDLLWNANENNRKAGFMLNTSGMSGEALAKRIGDGRCFVAYDGDKLVGTGSVREKTGRYWYHSGPYAAYMLAAVLPGYQGMHINSEIEKRVTGFAEENSLPLVQLDTASGNDHAIAIYQHQGFKLVDFQVRSNADHYIVVMVKWLKKQPYPEIYRVIRYFLKRLYIRARYKEGRLKRLF